VQGERDLGMEGAREGVREAVPLLQGGRVLGRAQEGAGREGSRERGRREGARKGAGREGAREGTGGRRESVMVRTVANDDRRP
jgi:hypothetical protein